MKPIEIFPVTVLRLEVLRGKQDPEVGEVHAK